VIDWDVAYRIATDYVATLPIDATHGDRSIIDDRFTEAYDFGWLFHFQSAFWIQTGDPLWQLLDNFPFLVDRRDGHTIPVPPRHKAEMLYRFAQQWAAELPLA